MGANGGGQRLHFPSLLSLSQVSARAESAAAHHSWSRERRRRKCRRSPRRRLQSSPSVGCSPHRRRLQLIRLRRSLALRHSHSSLHTLLAGIFSLFFSIDSSLENQSFFFPENSLSRLLPLILILIQMATSLFAVALPLSH